MSHELSTHALEAHALSDAQGIFGAADHAPGAERTFRLTDKWGETARARAVPESFWDPGAGAWLLPADCEADSARIALRLFPMLFTDHPEIVDLAAVQDVRPVNNSTEEWVGRPTSADPWQRTLVAARAM